MREQKTMSMYLAGGKHGAKGPSVMTLIYSTLVNKMGAGSGIILTRRLVQLSKCWQYSKP